LKGEKIVTGLRQTGGRWNPALYANLELEAALKCRSCKKGRYAPPVRMIKLTATQEITPYKWLHPDEER
jgi:hypothetical protein